jgi:phospholipid/cholesterol/gamma-HCH transport system substrate-binding protein
MKNTLETRLGLFVSLAIIAAVLIIETIGGLDIFRRGYSVHAFFNSVQELKVGDRVKIAGVEIGQVDNIALADNKVDVTLKLRADSGVKTDSIAKVQFTGLMGQNFVSISFGSPESPMATEGTVLTTAEQPDLSAIMSKLDNVASGIENITKSFSGDKIENILGPLTDFVKQNSGQLTATIANIREVTGQISQGKGTVGKLIYDDSLYNATLASMTDLQTTIADARSLLDTANSGQGSLGKLLKDDTLYLETTSAMTNLKEILQKINQGQGSVGKLVNDQDFYKNIKLTLQKVDKATEGLEDQGPLSVLGMAVNNLF